MSATPSTVLGHGSPSVERFGATVPQTHSTADPRLADASLPPSNSEPTAHAVPSSAPSSDLRDTEQLERAFALMRAHSQGALDDTAALARVGHIIRERDELRIEREALRDRCRLLEEEVALLRNIVDVKVAFIENWMNAMDIRFATLEDARAAASSNSQS